MLYTSSTYSIKESKTTLKLHKYTFATHDEITIPLNFTTISELTWTPNKNVLSFLTPDSNGTAVVLLNIETNATSRVRVFPIAIKNHKWSDNGNLFGFSAEVYPGKSINETVKIDEEIKALDYNKRIYDQLFAFRWDTWTEGKYSHIFFIETTADETTEFVYTLDQTEVDVMLNMDGNCPAYPFGLFFFDPFLSIFTTNHHFSLFRLHPLSSFLSGGSDEYALSPDGTHIAFSVQTGHKQAWHFNRHVYLVDITTPNEHERISTGEHNNACPLFVSGEEEEEGQWDCVLYQGTEVLN